MAGRRGRRRWSPQTLLPLRRTRQLSNTVSCWYCDCKFLALNEPLFRFGRKHARYLRGWFSMGVGFSLSAVVGLMVFVLCQLVQAALVHMGYVQPDSSLRWLSFLNAGLNISPSSIGYVCISTVISVMVHEFGHALAASSEGVKMEYLAIFLAGLFPGALVAFNHTSLLALPRMASLRIYCAGVWHNAVVLDVPSVSPLSGYLSPHDIIHSLNNFRIHNSEEWKQIINDLTKQTLSHSSGLSSGLGTLEEGYCIPHSLIEESTLTHFEGNQTYCPSDLTAFTPASCLVVSGADDVSYMNKQQSADSAQENVHCLDANNVVKLRRCACNHEKTPQNQSGSICSQVESCMMPVQLSGQGWAEITYSRLKCLSRDTESLYPDEGNSSSRGKGCLQTFVFVGDLISMSHSIHMTSYLPRSIHFATWIPNKLEKILTCAFHVSLLVALLNSLPVYYLDGESILEAALNSFDSISSRTRQLVLRSCLLVGTFVSACRILQTAYFALS
ncbi:membrane-bound transcription factor site-2 protease homolog isoform X2 [Andrographis paniculata]|uniref:membrane-bound transcription factor site-2 protease homolog isoform X2 n=1 Tax=Andrographis paniculata TaxID=175694 RepID=UPI0021E6DFF8|nr:membrane-bound transcription factor site-2 protease homolog isoform X2 [Andrographis paniculata]